LPELAIVIVSFNVKGDLEACLRSLEADGARSRTIVVVDNASSDGSAAMVRTTFPDVRLIERDVNLGFARANNLGIRATTSEYVLLLNPDTIVPPGAIVRLVEALASDPDAAAAGPRLVDAEGRPELSFGWTIGPLGELRQKVLGACYARGVGLAVRRVEHWTRRSGPREWVSGACLLVRRRDLDAVGLLDERYFMYTEDVDLCVAFRQRGRRVLFVAEVEVQHLRGRSAATNPRLDRLRRQSQLAYYEKHHPRWVPLLRTYLRLTGKLT
jgi:N-acetylglucosaminyl-diphospho-decaprenol L-rhamnosyltransferase